MEPKPLQFVAELVTPAVMISAAGLLLLGLHSKYSNIVSRIRHIIEKRNVLRDDEKDHRGVANLEQQIRFLMYRAWCARNAIFCLYVSILLMISTSICYAIIQVGFLFSAKAAVVVFVLGIVALFIGCLFALIEVQFAYKIIRLEVERHDASYDDETKTG